MDTRGNALLVALPAAERELLNDATARVPLTFKAVLQEADEPVGHLRFPRSGVGSMVSELPDGSTIEVATIGREGMIGLPLVLDAEQSAQRVFVQVPGEADQLPKAAFRELRNRLPALERLLLRYAMSLVSQIAQGSACNRLHSHRGAMRALALADP